MKKMNVNMKNVNFTNELILVNITIKEAKNQFIYIKWLYIY